jgi:uncharacterized glyoxalase superfamily protein PhnB
MIWPMMLRKAQCACGRLQVACEGDPALVSLCHCLECQRRTGSTYGIAAFFPREAVAVSGAALLYSRTGDSGFAVDHHFCPTCGGTVYWEPQRKPGFLAVAVGAFADPAFPAPGKSVYGHHKHPWVTTPTEKPSGEPVLLGAEPQLFVTDLAAAIDFYRDRLGFSVRFTYGEPPFYAQIVRGAAPLNLRHVDVHPVSRERRMAEHLVAATLVVENIEPLFRAYSEAGVAFFQPLKTEQWGSRMFITSDPDGNLVCFAGDDRTI